MNQQKDLHSSLYIEVLYNSFHCKNMINIDIGRKETISEDGKTDILCPIDPTLTIKTGTQDISESHNFVSAKIVTNPLCFSRNTTEDKSQNVLYYTNIYQQNQEIRSHYISSFESHATILTRPTFSWLSSYLIRAS